MINFIALVVSMVLVADSVHMNISNNVRKMNISNNVRKIDSGWLEYNNHYWKAFSDKTTQPKADDACHTDGAQLASVHSEDENKFVQGLIEKADTSKNSSYWIGLKLTRHSTTDKVISAHWNDGSEMGYGDVKVLNAGQHPWGKYQNTLPEPSNNGDTPELCVVFPQEKEYRFAVPIELGWVDVKCEAEFGRVCKK